MAEDRLLSVISGHIRLTALDGNNISPFTLVKSDACLFDTGTQITCITENLLSEEFKRYITEDPIFEGSRYDSGATAVQLDGLFSFSGSMLKINTMVKIYPPGRMINGRSGVIIGQLLFIDSLMYRTIPKSVLVAKGQVCDEQEWGDIQIEEYLDEENKLIRL